MRAGFREQGWAADGVIKAHSAPQVDFFKYSHQYDRSILNIKTRFIPTYNKLTFPGCPLGSVSTPDSYVLEEEQFLSALVGLQSLQSQ